VHKHKILIKSKN